MATKKGGKKGPKGLKYGVNHIINMIWIIFKGAIRKYSLLQKIYPFLEKTAQILANFREIREKFYYRG